MKRREFVTKMIFSAGLAASADFLSAIRVEGSTEDKTPNYFVEQTRSGEMLYRTLGKTGEKVSAG